MEQIVLKRAQDALVIERQTVERVEKEMDWQAFSRAVDAMAAAGKIVTSGCGNSGIATKKLAHCLCCIERPACFMPPSEAVHGGLGVVQAGDVVVLVSRGGKTEELMPIAHAAGVKRATLVVVTENTASPLAEMADIVLPLQIERECDKYNMMATASFVATVALFDALLCAVMELTGYEKEEFALIHPGGAVGKRLNG